MKRRSKEESMASGIWVSQSEKQRVDVLVLAGLDHESAQEYAEVSWSTLPKNIRVLFTNSQSKK